MSLENLDTIEANLNVAFERGDFVEITDLTLEDSNELRNYLGERGYNVKQGSSFSIKKREVSFLETYTLYITRRKQNA